MSGLTGLGRMFSPTMRNSENYNRDDGGRFSSPVSHSHRNFPKTLQFAQEQSENLPEDVINILQRSNELNGKTIDKDIHHNTYHKSPLSSRYAYIQEPFAHVHEPFSNISRHDRSRVSFDRSIIGNDALRAILDNDDSEFLLTLQGIIASPAEYQRHKENGTLPTDKDLKSIEDNILRKIKVLTSEKMGTISQPDDVFGGVKDMFYQNLQQKNNGIQKLIGGGELNTSSQDVSGLQDALTNSIRL